MIQTLTKTTANIITAQEAEQLFSNITDITESHSDYISTLRNSLAQISDETQLEHVIAVTLDQQVQKCQSPFLLTLLTNNQTIA